MLAVFDYLACRNCVIMSMRMGAKNVPAMKMAHDGECTHFAQLGTCFCDREFQGEASILLDDNYIA